MRATSQSVRRLSFNHSLSQSVIQFHSHTAIQSVTESVSQWVIHSVSQSGVEWVCECVLVCGWTLGWMIGKQHIWIFDCSRLSLSLSYSKTPSLSLPIHTHTHSSVAVPCLCVCISFIMRACVTLTCCVVPQTTRMVIQIFSICTLQQKIERERERKSF